MRLVSFLLTLSALAGPSVRAEPLEIHGTTGYAGEYELSGSVSEQDSNGKKEFSGPLTVKHVGLCTYEGPFSESYHGFMDCGDGGSLPLRLWTK